MIVMVSHLNLIDFGWIAVASFYVLSGFLITRVLFRDVESASSLGPYLKRFYIRRILRIFPVYYVYLLILVALMPFFGALYHEIHGQIGFAFVHVYNLFMLTTAHHGTHVLDHLWSMSLEEQLYFAWPLVVYLLGRQRLPWLLVALVIAGPIIRWATVAYWPPALPFHFIPREKAYFGVFFSTFSHLDAFALGASMNYLRVLPRSWWLAVTLPLSYLIAVPVQGWGIEPVGPYSAPLSLGYPLSMPHGYQYVWGYTVMNFNMALLICAISQAGRIQNFFSHPALDWLGQRSMTIYIIHYGTLFAMEPLLRVMKQGVGHPLVATFLFIPLWFSVVFVAAHVLHERIEKPVFKLKDKFSPVQKPQTVATAGAIPTSAESPL
jgi:peptidoglycan/LPS O-acetylase OafA/YrhL